MSHCDYFFDVDKRTTGKSLQSEKKAVVDPISVVLHPNSGFDRPGKLENEDW